VLRIRTIHGVRVCVSLLALLASCKKPDAAPAGTESTAASVAVAPSPEPSPTPAVVVDTTERARKQSLLEYANMEDAYLNDAAGQWASSVRASSSFGDKPNAPVDSVDSNAPFGARGAPDAREWTNNNQSIGMDWLEASFVKPVSATEVRVVVTSGVSAVSKLELIDAGGVSHVVWQGVNDVPQETRGPRTWFVRKFDATPYQVKAVKVTIANAMQSDYKRIDAVQLVGK
jgi:hypothetical protein